MDSVCYSLRFHQKNNWADVPSQPLRRRSWCPFPTQMRAAMSRVFRPHCRAHVPTVGRFSQVTARASNLGESACILVGGSGSLASIAEARLRCIWAIFPPVALGYSSTQDFGTAGPVGPLLIGCHPCTATQLCIRDQTSQAPSLPLRAASSAWMLGYFV